MLHSLYMFLSVMLVGIVSPADADDGLRRGKMLAQSRCANCHAIEKSGNSPLRQAPPFRILHRRYPIEALEEALAEGIATGHPQMPLFRFSPNEIGDLTAYLKTLQ